jgi:hypothetical protein
MFEEEGHGQTKTDAESHRDTERNQEDANSVEDCREVNFGPMEMRKSPIERM